MTRSTSATGLFIVALASMACSTDASDMQPGELTAPGTGTAGMLATAGGSGAGTSGAGAAGTPTNSQGPTAGVGGSGGQGAQPTGGSGTAGAGAAGQAGGMPDAGMAEAGAGGGSAGMAGASGAGGGGMGGGGSGGEGGRSGAGSEGEPPVMDRCVGQGGMVLNETIVVPAGQTLDGQCRRYIAGAALGDGSQSESQKPMFRLEDGARLVNVVLGSPAADGIHTYGDVTLANIVWEDIGEDALTIKESGTVELDGGSAVNGEDKVFQINAASTFRVSNFRADNAGKFIRQNGKTTFKIEVYIDRCDISNMDEAIFRTDSMSSTVTMTNTRYHNIGDALFIGVTPGNITQSNNTEY